MGKRSNAPRLSLGRQILAIMALTPMVVLPPHALALPSGGEVVAGAATTDYSGNTLTVTQTGMAGIMNWTDFSIGAGEIVNVQQAAGAALLNRVTGANPSSLLGQFNADGRVILINPNGVIVGADATINMQAFIASALDVDNDDFLNFANGESDSLGFSGDSTDSVVNLGKITATNGDVLLVAYRVANQGEISAAKGVAGLAAGSAVRLRPEENQLIYVETNLSADAADGTGVSNSGTIEAVQAELKASGGNLYALAVNQTGIVHATGVENRNGRVLLTAQGGAVAHTSGTISAHNADGSGGEVLVGGDYHGANPNRSYDGVYAATTTTIGAGATIDVSSTGTNAAAGRVVVWADGTTTFAGTVLGQGDSHGGAGGTAVIAGDESLALSGTIDVSASAGDAGTVVLGLPQAVISDTATHDTANGTLSNAALSTLLGSANVVVDAFGGETANTAGAITVDADLGWTSANRLTLKSGESVTFNAGADLTASQATVEIQAMQVSSQDSLTIDAGATLTAAKLIIGQNADAEFIGFNPTQLRFRTLGNIDIAGQLTVDTLDIKTENAGIEGDVSVANAANAIGTLTSSATSGTIVGDINVVDGSGGLVVSGDFSNIEATELTSFPDPVTYTQHATSIVTTGDLTLASGTKLASTTSQDVVLAAQGGAFINNAGSDAVAPGTDGRFLIYSNAPATTTAGGLVGAPVYDRSYAANAPSSITASGNRFLYTLAPTLTFTADDLARLYGADNPTLTFTVSGLVGDDAAADAFSGTPTLSTTATSATAAGTAAITTATGSVVASDYNYKIAFAPGTLTINPAPLTIAANANSRSVGQADPTFTATFTGLVNGDTSADIAGLVFSTNATVDSPAGSYTITPSGATNANYSISFSTGVLTLNEILRLTITADNLSKLYGAALPDFTATITGFTGTDDESIVSGLTFATNATDGSNVGTYTITPSGAVASGYEIQFEPGTLTINPALLTLRAENAARTYGAANPTFSLAYDGFVNGDDASVVSGATVTTTATASSNVDSYALTVAGATAANYTITTTAGTLTVTPAALNVTVDDATRLYGDTNPTFTATDSGLVLDQSLADLGTLTFTTAATATSGVGTYAVTGSFQTATTLVSNYDITFNGGSLGITPRALSIVVADASRSYGDANPNFTYTFDGTAPTGGSLADLLDATGLTIETSAVAASDIGIYTLTAGGVSDANFNLTFVPGTLTINPVVLTIDVNNAARTYGDANPDFSAAITGVKAVDTLAGVIGDLTFSTAATAGSDVGTYTVSASASLLNANYTVSALDGVLTINRASLFIAPTLSSRLYGDADPSFSITATGLRNDDTADVVNNLNFSGSAATAGVGSHANTILSATARNYDLTFGAGTINVLPRPLTITADDFAREYGEANPTFTATFDGLASFDASSVITGLSLSTVASASSSVVDGGYGIAVSSNANRNYDITYAPGRLTVTPAELLVSIGEVTRFYGDANPLPDAAVATGLKLDDTIATLGLQVVSPATVASDVGAYAYTATTTTPNYAVKVIGGTLNILPALLTVDIVDAYRVYGDANPDTFNVRLDGLKFAKPINEVVAVSTLANERSGVGRYGFDATILDPNYTIVALAGDLVVTPRPLDVVATGTRVYGDPNPDAITFNLTGDFVNGDLGRDAVDFFSYDRSLALDSDVGRYDVTTGARYQPANSNYLIRSFSASLGITPRPISVVIEDVRRFYGDANPAFRLSTESNIVQSFDAIGDVLRFIAPDERTDGGTYEIGAELINSNYSLASLLTGSLFIDPRPLTIEVGSSARYYGDDNADFVGATYGGLGLPEWVDPATFLSFVTVAPTNARSNVGHYVISARASDIDLRNYAVFNFTPGVLTVLPRPLQLSVADLTVIFAEGTALESIADLSGFDFQVSADNLANGDTVAELFPHLGFELWQGDKVVTAAAEEADPASYQSPSAEELEANGGVVGVGYGDFVPVVIDGVAEEGAVATASLGGSFSIPIDIRIETREEQLINETSVELLRTVGLTDGSWDGSANYVVTGVSPGVLTLKTRKLSDEQITLLEEEGEDALFNQQPIVVRSLNDYTSNFGLLFSDFPDLAADMVTNFLRSFLGQGVTEFDKDSLFFAIFGKTSGSFDDLDPAAIQAWLSDIATNPAKRGAIGGAMVSYLDRLQDMDPSDFSPGQEMLTEVVAKKFQDKRDEFAGQLYEQELQFEQTPNASRVYFAASNAANVGEQRAAVAAMDFLHYERDNLTDAEISILEQIQASIIDDDSTSTLPLLQAWFEARGDRAGDAFIDSQFRGFITELTNYREQMTDARVDIDAGVDRDGVTDNTSGLQMAHDFVNMDPPYGEFLQHTTYAGLQAKMARYDSYANKQIYQNLDVDAGSILSDGVVAGSLGGAAAGGITIGAIATSAGSIAKVMFPYAERGKDAAAWFSKGMTAGSGMAAVVAIVVQVGIEGTITAVKLGEQKTMYKSIVDDLGTNVSFSDLDLSSETTNVMAEDPSPKDMQGHLYKSLLVDGLEELLIGG